MVVVPTIRPESHARFVKEWRPLFERHNATLITVWDGENPVVEVSSPDLRDGYREYPRQDPKWDFDSGLFCRFTDSCRNLGFVAATQLGADRILTLDDDCFPPVYDDVWEEHGKRMDRIKRLNSSWRGGPHDPIQAHLDALTKRVPISWMNTAHDNSEYLRGVPYGVRDEAPVMLSHGVWVGTPDFDGETQLRLESRFRWECPWCSGEGALTYEGAGLCRKCQTTMVKKEGGVPSSLPYYVGPVPKGVQMPICGMNVMVTKEALPYLYYAPMGRDTGVTGLNRFGDIWMGIFVKEVFDKLGWAVYTGSSVVNHSRASDAKKNFEQEKLGRRWNEWIGKYGSEPYAMPKTVDLEVVEYLYSWRDKRSRYAELIKGIRGEK